MNIKVVLALVGIAGFGGGFAAGYVVCNRRNKKLSAAAVEVLRETRPSNAVRKVGSMWLDAAGEKNYTDLLALLERYGCKDEVSYVLNSILDQRVRDKRVRKAVHRVSLPADKILVTGYLTGMAESTIRCCKGKLVG